MAKIRECEGSPDEQKYILDECKGPYWHDEGIVHLDETEQVSELGVGGLVGEPKSKVSSEP